MSKLIAKTYYTQNVNWTISKLKPIGVFLSVLAVTVIFMDTLVGKITSVVAVALFTYLLASLIKHVFTNTEPIDHNKL